MNFRNRMLATFALVALTLGLFSSSQSVLAVSGCQKVKGNLSVVDNGNGTTSGTITQGGRLNGTVQEVFTSAITPTPDPNAFSLTNDYTVTTRRGVLKTHNVGIFDIALGVFTDFRPH